MPAGAEPFRARLAGFDSDWNLRFAEEGGERTLAAADLAYWGGFVEPTQGSYVVLPGGGIIVADDVTIHDEKLLAATSTFGKVALPLEGVSGLILRPPANRAAGDKLLARVLSPGGRGDRLLLDNDDELAGTFTSLSDAHAALQLDAAPLEIKRDAVATVMLDPTLVNRPIAGGLRMVVGFRDGSRVTAIEAADDGPSVRLKLAGGVAIAAPRDEIVALQTFGGRSEYLSDLQPTNYRHTPYLELSWPYYTDRSVTGSQLRAAGRLYLKGLGMHSSSLLTYDLEDDYRRFETEIAIDDATRGRGSVVFRVVVDDGSGTWQVKASSEIVRGGDPPRQLSVDLSGVKRIGLQVGFADWGDELDHADWLNARLVR